MLHRILDHPKFWRTFRQIFHSVFEFFVSLNVSLEEFRIDYHLQNLEQLVFVGSRLQKEFQTLCRILDHSKRLQTPRQIHIRPENEKEKKNSIKQN